jgi:phenylacetate-CoA ligase
VKVVAEWISKAYGTFTVLRHMRAQRRVPYLPPEELRALRDRQVRQIVRYAAQTVPYYRECFREQGIDAADIRSAEDLDRLPLLTKEMVRSEPQRFCSTSRLGREALRMSTTGSTAEPLDVYLDRQSILMAAAYGQRQGDALRTVLGGDMPRRIVRLGTAGTASARMAAFIQEKSMMRRPPQVLELSTLQPMEEVIEAINDFRPDSISGYGSYIEPLFRTVARQGIQMHLPRLVFYGASEISPSGIRLIEEEFGVPVMAGYGATEAPHIAFMCERRDGYHVNVDLVHLRLVDAGGESVPQGQVGEVVVSNLYNRGSVLLNYRLGDLAVLSREPCPCGRTLPRLANLEGRVRDPIYLPNGRFVTHYIADLIFYRLSPRQGGEVLQYQLIQWELDRFELRLATVDRAAFARVAGLFVEELRQTVGDAATIETVYYQGLLPGGRKAKARRVISFVGKSRSS